MRDDVMWCAAAPLWGTGGTAAFERPEILRFAGDDFMDQVEATLAADPRTLSSFVAANETWRGAAPPGSAATKLFQPSHNRFYLVAASLVCSRHWLPDKKLDTTKGESAFFVMRRLRPADAAVPLDASDPATYAECAWVEGDSAGWEDVGADALAEGERRLPMFPLRYREERGRAADRRLFAGLVPVSGREALEAAPPVLPSGAPSASTDPLAGVTDERLGPLVAVIEGLHALDAALAAPVPASAADAQASLYFALLDLADWLVAHVPAVWTAAAGVGPAQTALSGLLDVENGFRLGKSWRDALVQANAGGPAAARSGPPPPVQGMWGWEVSDAIAALDVEGDRAAAETTFFETARLALLEASSGAATGPAPAGTDAAPPGAEDARTAAAGDGSVYVLRCAYERPQCRESHRVRLSAPSRPVTLAHFYDPDAPFRTARIPTPLDTSLEGLRKFPKSVSMSISKQLRAQIERMQGATISDLEDGNVGSGGGVSFGMVCQLSIPIITICALILLMIIVSLLNIVFWWIPLFKICLPTVESE